ncbi:hypothetical protein [Photobacterium sp. TY1-4]|uniref:hypothetical protein n=1 Tax=Photobacterium sp. TY1-4 TaxID=2899122 RepID=UPI0021BEE9F1|nr:hypothetical protein [Photobacterium sp. TY1-4]UXI03965.1 hypothetical protein NH461_17785 [Photobacterium sp. TY1-4]
MKKAVYLLSVLALAGCNEEDLKDLAEGNTKVFTITGARVASQMGTVSPGYYRVDAIASAMTNTSQDKIPAVVNPEAALANLGINIEGETCGRINITGELCFESGDSGTGASCLPEQIDMLGLSVYTIDLDKVKTASDAGFYPTLAADVGGLYVDIDYDQITCSQLPTPQS